MSDKETNCCGPSCCSSDPAATAVSEPDHADRVRESVREHYARLIGQRGGGATCCASPVAEQAGYRDEDLAALPGSVRTESFGCGAPIGLADLAAGETVLDIGSGAGLDVLLAAREVGPTGRVIGLDMTPEMIATARENIAKAGVENAEILQGYMEAMPIGNATVDCVVSNCVINLSPDKPQVFREIARILKPGGRVLVSDIVTHGLPPEVRQSAFLYNSCVGGALDEEDYVAAIRDAGLEDVKIVAKHTYDAKTIGSLLEACCSSEGAERKATLPDPAKLAGLASSVYVAARKPG